MNKDYQSNSDKPIPPDLSCPLFAAQTRARIYSFSEDLNNFKLDPRTFCINDIREIDNNHIIKQKAMKLTKTTEMDPELDGNIIVPGLINALIRGCDKERINNNLNKYQIINKTT